MQDFKTFLKGGAIVIVAILTVAASVGSINRGLAKPDSFALIAGICNFGWLIQVGIYFRKFWKELKGQTKQ